MQEFQIEIEYEQIRHKFNILKSPGDSSRS